MKSMRKTKLVLLATALLLTTLLFSSCSGTIGNVDALLNTDYAPSEYLHNSEDAVSELTGYVKLDEQGDLVSLSKQDGWHTSYKVYNLETQTVVASFSNTDYTYTLSLCTDVPAFRVSALEIDAEKAGNGTGIFPISPDAKTSYMLYDAMGNTVSTTHYAPASPYMITDDTMIFNYALYRVDGDGVITKEADLPESLVLTRKSEANDRYIYIRNGSSMYIYDYSFRLVANYTIPSYGQQGGMHVLNNGKVVAQYVTILPDDEIDYDFESTVNNETRKCNLYTVLINPENGEVKDVDLQYLITSVTPRYELSGALYNNRFENLAVICRIEDRRIDTSASASDLVLMNNDAGAENSVKLVKGQKAVAPKPIGNDLYLVEMLDGGSAVIDSSGKLLHTLNNNVTLVGKNFVGSRAIYDLEMVEIYDLTEHEATVLPQSAQNTLYIREKADNGYRIKMLYNGEISTIYEYDEDSLSNARFRVIEGVGYMIGNASGTEFRYYNAAGEYIVTTAYELSVVASTGGNETVLLAGTSETQLHYHLITVES